jgi:hypothetical protein
MAEANHYRFVHAAVAGVLDHFAQTEPQQHEREGPPNISIEKLGAVSLRVAKYLEAVSKWGGEIITKTGGGLLHLCEGDEPKCPSVDKTPDGQSIRIRGGGDLVAIGDDRENNAETYMRRQADLSEGKLTVKKALPRRGQPGVGGPMTAPGRVPLVLEPRRPPGGQIDA